VSIDSRYDLFEEPVSRRICLNSAPGFRYELIVRFEVRGVIAMRLPDQEFELFFADRFEVGAGRCLPPVIRELILQERRLDSLDVRQHQVGLQQIVVST
jgi:hypothetical protein